MNKNRIFILVATVTMILAMLLIGPMDVFTHGYFCDEVTYEQIAEEDFLDYARLEGEEFEMTFTPLKRHFAGFEINLAHQPENNTGELLLSVIDENGKVLDVITADLSKVKAGRWYKLYTNANLKMNKVYTLRFTSQNCGTAPYLQLVDADYLPRETVSGNVLLGYAYAESTFTFQNKILICLFLVSAWGCACSFFIADKYRKFAKMATTSLFLVTLLSWNYMYNSMDVQNNNFSSFQMDSETLVTGVICAEQKGIYFKKPDEVGFGLGRYYDVKGEMISYGMSPISAGIWLNGYSQLEAAIIVNSNDYTKEVAIEGNYVGLKNGELVRIIEVEDNGTEIEIYLESDRILIPIKHGDVDKIRFYDIDKQVLAPALVTAYKSQYGLQGKIFRHLARYMDEKQAIPNLNLLCCFMTATVFVIISMLIALKYNVIMAGCFFGTFWLSPWIVNYARNLYWVEFTWFLPMAIGLFCALKINSRKCRMISYIAAFIAVTGKCLCGYEYISTVMMGLIVFLFTDFIVSIVKRDKERGKLFFRTTFIIGVIALAGFMTAICIHASLKGDGNIIVGIRNIFEEDVLRRTAGANLNDFTPDYWPSFNASVWDTLRRYFYFTTEIVVGISGNLFPLLCIIPICIFMYEYKYKELNVELVTMYTIFFLTSISWFCLAKGHSYIHVPLNYVLWYFGYIQICFYIIIDTMVKAVGQRGCEKG